MDLKPQLAAWLSRANDRVDRLTYAPGVTKTGRVETIGDGVATVSGLPNARIDELIQFEDGTKAVVLKIEGDQVSCVLMGSGSGVVAGSRAVGISDIIRVPVGDGLLGRVVDATGAPLDGGSAIATDHLAPVERPAPGIVDRELVTEPLLTGLTVIDAMVPLGRGQRELIIGDRKTGKTTIAIDAMINQRDSDVICVYAAIGQKASTVARVIEAVRTHGAMERCIFVVGGADDAPGAQWITPYAACSIAEYFRDRGQHALLILDDLTKHAIVYRQISLLLRKPPGREAYPGDVFYLHARLLERAAKLNDDLGGGSLTALPIAETQAGNLTAYIPTNLISITDGQIYLEPKLFFEGQKPAVNVGLSVSRVGGATQAKAIKALAETLKLDYAQFLELEVFTRFGAMVDDRTRERIDHGRRIRAIMAQGEFDPLPLAVQVSLLLAVADRKLDDLDVGVIAALRNDLKERLPRDYPRAVKNLERTMQLTDADREAIGRAVDASLADLAPPPAPDTTE